MDQRDVRRTSREAHGENPFIIEEQERRLEQLLDRAATGTDDRELQRAILERTSHQVRLRATSLLPAAVGIAIMAGGAAFLGDLPGASLLGLAPDLGLGAGLSVAGGVGGMFHAVSTALEAIHSVVPAATALTATGLAALGTALLALAAWRVGRST